MCSHPRTGDATDEKIAEKNREKFNELNFLRLNHGLVRGWLHRRFSPRAGDASISKKSHHHRKQKIARVAAALWLVQWSGLDTRVNLYLFALKMYVNLSF